MLFGIRPQMAFPHSNKEGLGEFAAQTVKIREINRMKVQEMD
jgi:hypothetical protein